MILEEVRITLLGLPEEVVVVVEEGGSIELLLLLTGTIDVFGTLPIMLPFPSFLCLITASLHNSYLK